MFKIIVTYHKSLKIHDRITFTLQFTLSVFSYYFILIALAYNYANNFFINNTSDVKYAKFTFKLLRSIKNDLCIN